MRHIRNYMSSSFKMIYHDIKRAELRNGGGFVHTTSALYPIINVCVWGNTVSSVIGFVKKRHFGALRLSKGATRAKSRAPAIPIIIRLSALGYGAYILQIKQAKFGVDISLRSTHVDLLRSERLMDTCIV